MTSKSEELCRLLGIEYKTVYNDGIGGGTQAGHYPDLTKPSNFVRLLELLTAKYLFSVSFEDNEVVIEGFPYYDHKRKNQTELFMDGLIAFFKSEYEDCGNNIECLKNCKKTYEEPAQQTEWEY